MNKLSPVTILRRSGNLLLAAAALLLLWLAICPDERTGWGDAVFFFRLCRSILGFLIGGSLALSGMIFQAIFRNPLADPYILGISSGAAAGAALMFIIGSAGALFFLVPLGAFGGALLTLMAVLAISGAGKSSTDRLLLSGVITGVIVSSILIYLVSVSDSEELAGVTWWILGDLQGGSRWSILGLGALALASLGAVRFFAKDLNALVLGDDEAVLLGVPVARRRMFFVVTASLLASTCVAVSGVIGFAGLIVPHTVRMVWGSDQRKIVFTVFLAGGCFLQFCDLIAVWLSSTREMPIGVVSSCIGGGIFLFLLMRRR